MLFKLGSGVETRASDIDKNEDENTGYSDVCGVGWEQKELELWELEEPSLSEKYEVDREFVEEDQQ